MEQYRIPTYHDRYDKLDAQMLRALIQAHEQILKRNKADVDDPIRLNTRMSIIALKAELETREGEELWNDDVS